MFCRFEILIAHVFAHEFYEVLMLQYIVALVRGFHAHDTFAKAKQTWRSLLQKARFPAKWITSGSHISGERS